MMEGILYGAPTTASNRAADTERPERHRPDDTVANVRARPKAGRSKPAYRAPQPGRVNFSGSPRKSEKGLYLIHNI